MTGATLGRLLKSGQSYQGKGRKSTFLTEDEEKIITHRLLEMANGAQVLNLSIVKQYIEEEIEIIKIDFPDRRDFLQDLMNHSGRFQAVVFRFAEKNGLRKYFPEDTRERLFQCDVCFKKFTFKNALVKHQKTVHYGFLYSQNN